MWEVFKVVSQKIAECDARFIALTFGAVVLAVIVAKMLISRNSALRQHNAVVATNKMLRRNAELMTLMGWTWELVIRDLVYLATHRTADAWRTWNHVWRTLVSGTGRVLSRSDDYRTTVILFARKDSEGDLVVPTISDNLSAQGEERLSLSVLDSLVGDSLMSGVVRYCDDTSKDPRYAKHAKTKRPYLSVACAPVVQDGRVVAILSVDARPAHAFTDLEHRHLEGLAGLAGHIALAGNDLFGWNVIDLIGLAGAREAAPTEEGQTGDGQGDEPSRKGTSARRAKGQGIEGRDHD